MFHDTNIFLDKNSNQTIFGMTQQFLPIIAAVLSPPEEQLTLETRRELIELVKFLFKTEPSILRGYDNLILLAD